MCACVRRTALCVWWRLFEIIEDEIRPMNMQRGEREGGGGDTIEREREREQQQQQCVNVCVSECALLICPHSNGPTQHSNTTTTTLKHTMQYCHAHMQLRRKIGYTRVGERRGVVIFRFFFLFFCHSNEAPNAPAVPAISLRASSSLAAFTARALSF